MAVSFGKRAIFMKGSAMMKVITIILLYCVVLLIPELVAAQAFGEYGRAVGSVPRNPATTPRTPGGGAQGRIDHGGVGDFGGRALPTLLVVASKEAGLFPRQDEEMEKIAKLTKGEKLVPLVQSEGSTPWYMVRTEKGIVGWVKSNDVRKDAPAGKQ